MFILFPLQLSVRSGVKLVRFTIRVVSGQNSDVGSIFVSNTFAIENCDPLEGLSGN